MMEENLDIRTIYPPESKIIQIEGSSKENHTCKVRLKCATKEDFVHWLSNHQSLSGVTFRVLKTTPTIGKSVLYSAVYRCHHNTYARSSAVRKPSEKLTGCEAKLSVTIKSSTAGRRVRSKDMLRDDYPTMVTAFHKHNHEVDAADALKPRDPTEAVKQKFLELFKSHDSPTKVLQLYKKDLLQEYGDDYFKVVADRSVCPDIQWVRRLYYSTYIKKYFPSEHENAVNTKSIIELKNKTGLDVEKLIREVRTRDAIWDQAHPDHHHRFVLGKMWNEIADKLKVTRVVARKKWKILRDYYFSQVESAKASKLKSEDQEGNKCLKSKWSHFESMKFILNQQMNNSSGNLRELRITSAEQQRSPPVIVKVDSPDLQSETEMNNLPVEVLLGDNDNEEEEFGNTRSDKPPCTVPSNRKRKRRNETIDNNLIVIKKQKLKYSSSRKATGLDVEKLIREVHARDAVWDQTHPEHHHRFVLGKMWNEIAEELNVTRDVARKKWKFLREYYLSQVENAKVSKLKFSDQEENKCLKSKWPHYASMKFILNQTKNLSSSDNLSVLPITSAEPSLISVQREGSPPAIVEVDSPDHQPEDRTKMYSLPVEVVLSDDEEEEFGETHPVKPPCTALNRKRKSSNETIGNAFNDLKKQKLNYSPSTKAMVLDVDKLISEVRDRVALWDKAHPDHHNRLVVSKMWKQIAAKLNVARYVARNKWKYLRQYYLSQAKELKSKNQDRKKCLKSNWPHHESMKFILKQTKNGSTSSKMKLANKKLIKAVHNRVVIWDQAHPDHHNRFVLTKMWKEIAAELNVTCDFARKKWKYLRDYCLMQDEKYKSWDRDGNKYLISHWPHYASMKFILNQKRNMSSSGNLSVLPNTSTELSLVSVQREGRTSAIVEVDSPDLQPEEETEMNSLPVEVVLSDNEGEEFGETHPDKPPYTVSNKKRKSSNEVIRHSLIDTGKQKLNYFQSRKATELNVEKLIREVHSRVVIWDQGHPDHHNRFVLRKMWDEVADKLNVTRDVARKKWKILRVYYLSQVESAKVSKLKSSDQEENKYLKSKWPHYESMKFILNQTKNLSCSDNLSVLPITSAEPSLISVQQEGTPPAIIEVESPDHRPEDRTEMYCLPVEVPLSDDEDEEFGETHPVKPPCTVATKQKRKSSNVTIGKALIDIKKQQLNYSPSNKTMVLDNEKLIREVQNRVVMWDQAHPDHHNHYVLTKMWKEIAAELNVTRDFARKKWKHLRDYCFSQDEKYKSWDRDGNKYLISHWPHYASMKFILNQKRNMSSSDNLSVLPNTSAEPSLISVQQEGSPPAIGKVDSPDLQPKDGTEMYSLPVEVVLSDDEEEECGELHPDKPPHTALNRKRTSSNEAIGNALIDMEKQKFEFSPCRKAMILDNEKLIREVQNRVAIWDQAHPDHHNHHVVTKMWNEIAAKLNFIRVVAQKRWKYLREYYLLQAETMNPEDQWPHYESMKFILNQRSNLSSSDNQSALSITSAEA